MEWGVIMGYVNLYKIDDNKQLEFTQLLQDKYEFIGEQEYKSLHDKDRKYIVGTYLYRANDSKIPDWQWILDEYECDKVKIYSSPRAILKIESDGIIYVISYGLAYFSVDKYCDVEFAFEFAKRIAFNEIKTTTLTAPNSRKNKIVNVFVDYSNLSYESGESYAKIKARMDTGKEKRLFNETIEIGHSIKAQLIQNNIDSIIEFIEYIEMTFKKPIINKIPVFGKVKDDELIADLDERLLKKINDNIDCINISELDVIGVTEIFNNNDSSFVLKYKRAHENIESLTKDAIMHFIETNKINIEKEFFNIKIACLKNEQIVCTYNIKRVIDFTDDERKCVLIKGEWYQYNSDYIAYLQESIKELDVIYDSKYDFTDNKLKEYVSKKFDIEKDSIEYHGMTSKQIKDRLSKKYYAERVYNCVLSESYGFENYDRENTSVQGEKLELMDLYKSETMFAVKIGNTSSKLSYVVDQSMASLEMYKNGQFPSMPSINTVAVWIVLKRKNKLPMYDGKPDISKLNMIMLKNRLDEWKKSVRVAGYTPVVYLNYWES